MSPYIPREQRPKIDAGIDVAAKACEDVGELTYALSRLCMKYLPEQPRYADYAEVVAALEGSKFELHRAHIGLYEGVKRRANGDVLATADTTTGGW